MKCQKCGQEFELHPYKPGYADVCEDCTGLNNVDLPEMAKMDYIKHIPKPKSFLERYPPKPPEQPSSVDDIKPENALKAARVRKILAEKGFVMAPKSPTQQNDRECHEHLLGANGCLNGARPPVARMPISLPATQIIPTTRNETNRTSALVIDDAFIREWEPRYDQTENDEPEYRRLVGVVGREISSTGAISKGTFLDIWKWKGAMRGIRFVLIDSYETLYAKAFRCAVSAPPQRKLYELIEPRVKLPGVEAATGSTLLHFFHPQTMPIIDVRTIGVLFKAGLISTEKKDLDHYEEFRLAIEGIRHRCTGWTLRQIDRSLFAYHKQALDRNDKGGGRCWG
jgi:hypothetical protein